ncbi:glycosyltransferase [Aestuariivivens insulae]|uniref:glycosyltransferase n=1 Tax=Aestuariivivens insulae TaxID=1621988 RepID=UPI001F583EEA|nr:glycosyltransferase [Aestuariivivens insulae]
MKHPLLSICLRTFNNEKFVLDALKGILMQKVNFDLELVCSDDCSEDHTYAVVKEAIKDCSKFVNIHLVRQPENLGYTGNLLYLLNNCKGDYIALCDGDDYWSAPNKLQLQVDFLEANPDFEVCFTNVCTIDEKGKVIKKKLVKYGNSAGYTMQDLPIIAPTSSRVFRNRDFSSISKTVPGEDTYMLLYQSKFGNIKFLDIVAGAYRYQSESVYSSLAISKRKDANLKTEMECMGLVTKNLYPKYQKIILKKIVELRYLDKELYSKRLEDFKSFMKTYPERFSVWASIKINFLVGVLRILDYAGGYGGRSFMLKVINKTF